MKIGPRRTSPEDLESAGAAVDLGNFVNEAVASVFISYVVSRRSASVTMLSYMRKKEKTDRD